MENIYLERLKQLADHLMTGQLGHERFDYGDYNRGVISSNGCGTAGCGIGECPEVFPDHWKFVHVVKYGKYLPSISEHPGDPVLSGRDFFVLSRMEYEHLFLPHSQVVSLYGGKRLGISATREEVAQNIYEFIKIKSKQD